MMNETDYAVERLTEQHTVMVEGQAGECDALLLMLKDSIYPSLGSGGASGGGDGQVLNSKAFTMYENIDGVVRAWLLHFGQDASGELCAAARYLHQTISTEHNGGRVEEDLYERLMGMFTTWVWQIEDLFDPPREKEITGSCPSCGERYEETTTTDKGGNTDTTRQAAVRIQVKPGRALIAECNCCGKMWATEGQLRELATGVGAIPDTIE